MCEICRELPENQMITYTIAKTNYKIRDIDFEKISCGVTRNPHTPGGSMRLYLLSDIIGLKDLKDKEQESVDDKNLQNRLSQLLKSKAPLKKNLNNKLFDTITADYFNMKPLMSHYCKKPKKGIRQVIRELRAGEEMYKYDIPQSMNLVYYFEKYQEKKSNIVKEGIKGYTADFPYPYNVVNYGLDLSDRKVDIFNIVSRSISSYLTKGELLNWCEAYSGEVFSQNLSNYSPLKIREKIGAELKRVLGITDGNISYLLCEKYENDLKRTYDYYMHPLYGIDATIEKILKIEKTKEDLLFKETRRSKLQSEFDKWDDIYIRRDSKFCSDFIDGSTLAEPEEVAAIMSLTSWLFSYSHISWENMKENLEERLRILVLDKSHTWLDAYKKLTNNRNIIRSASGRWRYRYW
jgi:hypothetical protein